MADAIKDRASVLGGFLLQMCGKSVLAHFCPKAAGLWGAQLFQGINGAARED